LEPEEILDRRLVKKGNKSYLQVLIKWSTMKEDMATWEDYEVLRQRFPDAAAWGQAAFQGGRDVRNPSYTPSWAWACLPLSWAWALLAINDSCKYTKFRNEETIQKHHELNGSGFFFSHLGSDSSSPSMLALVSSY
jgi:hypothetical protein